VPAHRLSLRFCPKATSKPNPAGLGGSYDRRSASLPAKGAGGSWVSARSAGDSARERSNRVLGAERSSAAPLTRRPWSPSRKPNQRQPIAAPPSRRPRQSSHLGRRGKQRSSRRLPRRHSPGPRGPPAKRRTGRFRRRNCRTSNPPGGTRTGTSRVRLPRHSLPRRRPRPRGQCPQLARPDRRPTGHRLTDRADTDSPPKAGTATVPRRTRKDRLGRATRARDRTGSRHTSRRRMCPGPSAVRRCAAVKRQS
jgi:hypothetical protein